MSVAASATALQAGFTQIPNAVLSLDLAPRELQLVVHLLRLRWTPETEIRPRLRTLAERMACSVRTVQRTVDSLAGRNLLMVEARYRNDGGRGANRYTLAPILTTVVSADGCHDVATMAPTRLAPMTRPAHQETYPRKETGRTGQKNGYGTPIQRGQCFGCGERHDLAECPRYGAVVRR